MKKTLKVVIPIIIIIFTIIVIYTIFKNPPEVKKEFSKSPIIDIEIKVLENKPFEVILDSYGEASASTQTTLTSQVSGKIIYVNENFKNGGYFKKGDLLVQIEDEDYKSDVMVAEAGLLLSKQALIEEQAKASQAKEDWNKFNLDGEPNDLVLRIPQLESAKANLKASQANLQKAKLNLLRTKILAPYNGRVLEKSVSIAQVISSNSILGTIFSNDGIEVRLPIKNNELNLIDIEKNIKEKKEITLESKLDGKKYSGVIVRSESSIDTNTKQLYLISKIQDESSSIRLGEYFTARIPAKTLDNVLAIPNDSIYQSSYVYIEKDGRLERKDIQYIWQGKDFTLVTKGLKANDHLVLTTLGQVSSGTKVNVLNKGIEK